MGGRLSSPSPGVVDWLPSLPRAATPPQAESLLGRNCAVVLGSWGGGVGSGKRKVQGAASLTWKITS
jgi:hypothetical protein